MTAMHNVTSGERWTGKLRWGDDLLYGIPVIFRERNISPGRAATSGADYSR